MRPSDATIVLDIGKTNCKLSLLDAEGRTLAERRRPNVVASSSPYPHHDTEAMWVWMLIVMGEFSALARVSAIVPVTHGATAALVDDEGLVLPVLDYECTLSEGAPYPRPPFSETLSPALPAGLNLGRQLAWQVQRFPAEFAGAKWLLMYPQYWAWRLSGVAASEVTSLGCHTDLWNPSRQSYSSLVDRMQWAPLLPPLREAWASLGALLPQWVQATGLPADCQVLCGIHDSNASLLRHLVDGTEPCTVLSTGTWVIAASLGVSSVPLHEKLDMLANCDVHGRPVPCMRFMGGREFSDIAGADAATCQPADLARLIARQTFALPSFAESGGPFAGRPGAIQGPPPETPAERSALATLYAVLMTDHCLTVLGSTSPVRVEGAFTRNLHFGPLLAALRPGQGVTVSDDSSGTTSGGWMLHRWGNSPKPNASEVEAIELPGWQDYRRQWQALIDR